MKMKASYCRTPIFAVAALATMTAVSSQVKGDIVGIDEFGLLLPAVQLVAGDGSVTPVPFALDDFRLAILGDGSVRQLTQIDDKIIALGDGSVRIGNVQITADQDPFLTFSFSVLNGTAVPLTVALTVTSPMIGTWTQADTDLTVTVTDANDSGAASAVPVFPLTTLGFFSVGLTDLLPGLVGPCSVGTIGGSVVCTEADTDIGSFSGFMKAYHSYTMTPGDSVVGVGHLTLGDAVAVPAPASLLLFGFGLLGFAATRRLPA